MPLELAAVERVLQFKQVKILQKRVSCNKDTLFLCIDNVGAILNNIYSFTFLHYFSDDEKH